MIANSFRKLGKQCIHRLFTTVQPLGFDILPRHLYSSIPDIGRLRASDHWRRPLRMSGVPGADVESQLAFVSRCCTEQQRARMRRTNIHAESCKANGAVGYGHIESDFLFAFISTIRPKLIIQVGAGVSTAVILQAADECGYRPRIVCVDPFPTQYLRRLATEGAIELVDLPAERVPGTLFGQLAGNDFLFIDSTHTVKPGSEVNRLILDVLPELPQGCWVHFHDIYFPYDYPAALFQEMFFPAESTLLHAFLTHNVRYRIAASLSMLHYQVPLKLREVLPNYRPATMQNGLHLPRRDPSADFPSATYLEVTH